jgi:DNA-directed RNA polymerase specialized sigma24 family protein
MRLLGDTETQRVDPLLVPFLRASERDAEDTLGSLLTSHARPVIQGILRRRLGRFGAGDIGGIGGIGDRGDLEGEVVLHLVERLRRLRREPAEEGIRDFRGYVAVATYNALAEQGRRREPERGRRREAEDKGDDPLLRLPDPAPDAAATLQQRGHIALLWEEIRRLPARQAAALLLNLRDAQRGNALMLLPLMGIASMREIARTLGMSAEDLAAIWNRLPFEDAEIAGLLGITRQQVINLRKSARERLARRMRTQ